MTNTSVPVTLHSNNVTFGDTNKFFKLNEDLLETLTNSKFNLDHSNAQDRKLNYELGKQMKFDIKQKGRPSNRDKSLIKLLNSPAILASGIWTIFLPSDPNELCERVKLLLQERQPGNVFDKINAEILVILEKLLVYKCISKKQHKQILNKRNVLHTKKK